MQFCEFPACRQKEIDHAIRTTFRNPPILASEDRAQYVDLKRLVLSDIKPRGLQETLLARDIVEAVGGLSAAVDEDCHHAVLPRVIKSRILEARGTRSLDRRLVPKICKHVTAVMAGDMSARQAADPFLQERIRCCAQPLRPPDRASPGSGYALPPSAYPRRHSHPDCRSILTLIVARYVNSTRLSSIGPAPFITSW